jgi:ketosteroid isomerase-like protein
MRILLTTTLLIALGAMAGAQVRTKENNPEKTKLIALENAWNQAQIHRDGQALDSLLADTFVYTDWDGTVLNKSRFMEDMKDPSVETTLVANEGVEVYLYPGAAVVTGAYHAKGKNKGRPFDHRGRFTDTWIQQRGQWICAASHTNLTAK